MLLESEKDKSKAEPFSSSPKAPYNVSCKLERIDSELQGANWEPQAEILKVVIGFSALNPVTQVTSRQASLEKGIINPLVSRCLPFLRPIRTHGTEIVLIWSE